MIQIWLLILNLSIIRCLVCNSKSTCCVSRPGEHAPAVTSHPQASTASAPGTHAVGSSASELSGSAAAGGSTAAPAVPRETQATVPTAATSHQQGTALSLKLPQSPWKPEGCTVGSFYSQSGSVLLV